MPAPKIVLITGANQGLGYLTGLLLARSPTTTYHVIVTSRSLAKAQSAIQNLTTTHAIDPTLLAAVEMDVSSPNSITSAFTEISKSHDHVDVLINNAGIASRNPNNYEQFTEVFATNVTGAATVTDTFLPLLRKSSDPRLVYVSSGLGSLTKAADPNGLFYQLDATPYRCSKAALNMMALQQSKFLGKEGIKVWVVDPGYRATNLSGDAEMAKGTGATDPMLGAEVVVGVVVGNREEEVGKLVSEKGIVLPW